MFNEYQHQDFDVVSTVDKFGGVEELTPKDKNLTVSLSLQFLYCFTII